MNRSSLSCLIVAVFSILAFGRVSLATELDPTLARNLFLIRSLANETTTLAELRLRNAGLPKDRDPKLKVFIYFDHEPQSADLEYLASRSIKTYPFTYLPAVGAHPFGFMLAEGRASAIWDLVRANKFPRLAAAGRKLSPKNDNTAVETGVAAARQFDPPLLGDGVRLAILDSGFRFEHPDLPDAAEAMDYSAYPDTSQDVTDVISGHGTHVAGTAFGNGNLSDGRWKGMAPNAMPIYFKIGDDSTADASSEAVVGAVRGAATWANADILSMSYGGMDGFNDGSSPEEQAVDWAVGQGVSVFMSAGNSASQRDHVSQIVPAHSIGDPIQVDIRFAPDSSTWGFCLVWYDGPDTSVHLDITAWLSDREGNLIGLDTVYQTSSVRGTDYREFLSREIPPPDTSTYFIQIINDSDVDQKVHSWTLSDLWYVRFPRADRGTTVLLPSTADSCISVGAYTSRNAWTDFSGDEHLDATNLGDIASFSSVGPRIDGLMKPNICAPGRRTISCRDTFNVVVGGGVDYGIMSNDGGTGLPADYVAFMGTSMSSPAAAGSAALILEANPDWSPAMLRQEIYRKARRDEQTGDVPNNTWGWGKLDILEVLDVNESLKPVSDAPLAFRIIDHFPNPSNGGVTLRYEMATSSILTVSVFDIGGRDIWNSEIPNSGTGEKSIAIPAEALEPSGTYFVKISSNDLHVSSQITIVR